MSTYGRFTPYLLNSTLPDRSTNSLPAPTEEDFDTTVSFTLLDVVVPNFNDPILSIPLPGWTDTAATLYVKNTDATTKLWVYFAPAEEGANPVQFITVMPGRSAVLSIDATATTPLQLQSGSATLAASADIIVLGNNT